MRKSDVHRLAVLAALAVLGGAQLALCPRSAGAQCSYTSLTASTPTSSGAAVTDYTFTSPGGSWGAIGIRSAAGSEHGLGVFSATAASPTCVQNSVGSSSLNGGVDFVIGDFRAGRNTLGPWYAQATRSSGSGAVLTEWDPGTAELTVDDDPITRNTDQVVDVYDVFLEAGVTYTIVFSPAAGVSAKVLVFKNPGTTAYWASRSGAQLESAGNASFQATVSDEYAIVVVNDDGGLSTYSLAVEQCQPAITLASGSAVSTSPPLRYQVPQDQPYWSACGVRGSGSDDWDITAFKTGHGTFEPVCFTDTLVTSAQRAAGVDFVVGDFNFNPTAGYFTRVKQFSGSQVGVVEWDDGPDEITVGAPPVARSTGPGDVLEVWDVSMNAGSTYSINFPHTGSADVKWLVFENAIQSASIPYWAGRGGAVLTGNGNADYVPTVTGYHGIVVINDNGGTGNYQLAIFGAGTGVGDGAALGPPGIEALVPNPSLGHTLVRYRVSKAARVAFDLIDVAGRRVASMGELDAAPGEGSLAWDAHSTGRRVPPGLYFVRMTVGGKLLSIHKFLLLP
jgi:hypothetical protein